MLFRSPASTEASNLPTLSNDSQSILTGIWAGLSRGVADTKHDWHWPVLATIKNTPSGPNANVRVVVLRAFNPSKRLIAIHSDSRALKIAELTSHTTDGTNGTNGTASLLFYDNRSRTQLRIQARATVSIDNSISQAAWAKLPEHGRTQYLGNEAPGSHLPTQLTSGVTPHFAVIELTIESLDWLILAREGHQRRHFSWDDQTRACTATALVP